MDPGPRPDRVTPISRNKKVVEHILRWYPPALRLSLAAGSQGETAHHRRCWPGPQLQWRLDRPRHHARRCEADVRARTALRLRTVAFYAARGARVAFDGRAVALLLKSMKESSVHCSPEALVSKQQPEGATVTKLVW